MIIEEPLWSLSYLAAILLLFGLVNWLIFRNDLPNLQRATRRLSLFAFYLDTAKRHSVVGLVLGLLACIGFVLGGSWIVSTETNVFIGWFTIISFGLLAVAWGYTLYLKFATG